MPQASTEILLSAANTGPPAPTRRQSYLNQIANIKSLRASLVAGNPVPQGLPPGTPTDAPALIQLLDQRLANTYAILRAGDVLKTSSRHATRRWTLPNTRAFAAP